MSKKLRIKKTKKSKTNPINSDTDNFFEANMSVLKKTNPYIYHKLTRINKIKNWRIQSNVLTNKEGTIEEPIYTEFEGHFISKNKLKFPTMIILLGLGSGAGLRVIIKFIGQKIACPILIIEKDIELIKIFLETNEVSKLLEEKALYIIGGEENLYIQLLDYLKPIDKTGKSPFADMKAQLGAIEFIEHPVLFNYHKEHYMRILGEFSVALEDTLSYYGNEPYDSFLGLENIISNVDIISKEPDIKQLYGKFKDVPAVIIATGPSLNKNIQELIGLDKNALLFSADASLRTLLNAQIKPQFAVSIERNLSTKNHFTQIDNKHDKTISDIRLLSCPVLKPETYKEWKGKHLLLFRKFAQFEWLAINRGVLDTGKSVTNMAFVAAKMMGCNPIVLVGQDLAFGEDGISHATGADHAREGLLKSELIRQRTMVMGNNGKMIESLNTWVGMLKRFEYDINLYGGENINATEGGAKIIGCKVMTLKEAKNKYMNKPIDTHKIIENNLSVQEISDLYTINNVLTYSIDFIKGIRNTSKEILEQLNKIVLNKDYDTKLIKEIGERINKTVSSKTFYLIFTHIVQSHIIKLYIMARQFVERFGVDNKTIDKARLIEYRNLCFLLIEFSEELEKVIKHGMTKIEGRL
ncbi:MAG: 6-hydroxymethylpterin diphosphokinase MptE-like protein [Thermodesulfobacteriota bacterium]|nr:6-hydroxymethylpterin diphosphokinase MptE-like protein [Thermodesulfobacteriota bacterium]